MIVSRLISLESSLLLAEWRISPELCEKNEEPLDLELLRLLFLKLFWSFISRFDLEYLSCDVREQLAADF